MVTESQLQPNGTGKNESHLQHQFFMAFGQRWPQYRKLLFEINNNAYSLKHAQHRKAMGMQAGAADMGFISPKSGIFCGIEFKKAGSKHSKAHILNQLEWGALIKKAGGYYIMTNNIEEPMALVAALITENYDLAKEIQAKNENTQHNGINGKRII